MEEGGKKEWGKIRKKAERSSSRDRERGEEGAGEEKVKKKGEG